MSQTRGSIYTATAILAALAPLQGTVSTGTVRCSAVGQGTTVVLRPGAIGVPISRGGLDRASAVVAARNEANARGEWEVVHAGTSVAVESVLAGPRTALPPGTEIAWLAPVAGLAATAMVEATGLSGGALHDGIGTPRQILHYKDLGGQQNAIDFFRAQLSDFPALVLAWTSSGPADASSQPGVGANSSRLGAGKRLMVHSWVIYVITSRLDGSDERRDEGDILRDAVLEQITDRMAFRGMTISSPRGLELLDSRVVQATPTSYVDRVTFSTQYTQVRRDDREFNPWLRTRLQSSIQTSQGPHEVVDVTDPMPQS